MVCVHFLENIITIQEATKAIKIITQFLLTKKIHKSEIGVPKEEQKNKIY